MRVGQVAIDLVRIDLMKGSHIAEQHLTRYRWSHKLTNCSHFSSQGSIYSYIHTWTKLHTEVMNWISGSFKISSKITDRKKIFEPNSTHFLGNIGTNLASVYSSSWRKNLTTRSPFWIFRWRDLVKIWPPLCTARRHTHTEIPPFSIPLQPQGSSSMVNCLKTKHSTFVSQTNSRKNCNICTTPSRWMVSWLSLNQS